VIEPHYLLFAVRQTNESSGTLGERRAKKKQCGTVIPKKKTRISSYNGVDQCTIVRRTPAKIPDAASGMVEQMIQRRRRIEIMHVNATVNTSTLLHPTGFVIRPYDGWCPAPIAMLASSQHPRRGVPLEVDSLGHQLHRSCKRRIRAISTHPE
jgi:hypothetical protein